MCFAEEDFNKIASGMLHQDFVVDEARGVPYSGEYHGPVKFFERFRRGTWPKSIRAGTN
jgi:hypothetical protein